MNVVSQTERIATLWVPAFSKALSAAYLAIHTPADCMSSVHLQLINRPRKEAHAIFSLVSQKSVASPPDFPTTLRLSNWACWYVRYVISPLKIRKPGTRSPDRDHPCPLRYSTFLVNVSFPWIGVQ